VSCRFKPERVSRSRGEREGGNLGEKLYQRGVEMESRKEKRRQEWSVERECTFKPQLTKKSEKIVQT